MQQPHTALKEIIWEITDRCSNGCTYCGSKHLLNKTKIEREQLLDIAEKIAEAAPDEINISGGDPLEIGLTNTRLVYEILKDAGSTVKVIVNPLSFSRLMDAVDTVFIYDWIGMSVNTEEELEAATVFMKSFWPKNITVISNFNTTNVFSYKKIEAFAKEYNLTWQVQYTMDENIAIYKNETAKEYFFGLIKESFEKGVQLALADNLNAGGCSAGKFSLGIQANGDVISCLSMQAWDEDPWIHGTLPECSLEEIWMDGFKKERYCSFKCCKDVCGSPYLDIPYVDMTPLTTVDPSVDLLKKAIIMDDGWKRGVMAYAVTAMPPYDGTSPFGDTSGISVVYGVMTNNGITYTDN